MHRTREEMEEQRVDEAAATITPAHVLRQTFFADLDASSKVNPNRRRPSQRYADPVEEERRMFQELRDDAMVRMARHVLPDGTVVVDDAYYDYVETSRSASPPLREPSPSRRSLAAASMSLHNTDRRGLGEGRVTGGPCAVLTNVVAGSLCGIALHRVTASVAGNIIAVAIGTQMLCWMGYATVDWWALLRDAAMVAMRGYQPRQTESKGHLAHQRERLLTILTATVPRRASFWAGVALGVVLA
ncbi:FUN14 family [Novymonas esmeraldas]|uniref:FUN14 family n=1 Tax=Novymonas esmeraldas TaxID=1808958 RepID=A0AAW0EQN1_9TRYP